MQNQKLKKKAHTLRIFIKNTKKVKENVKIIIKIWLKVKDCKSCLSFKEKYYSNFSLWPTAGETGFSLPFDWLPLTHRFEQQVGGAADSQAEMTIFIL